MNLSPPFTTKHALKEDLETYIRNRAKELNLSLSEVCRLAGLSRQTIYSLGQVPAKLPTLQTVIALSEVLHVHPLRLLHLILDDVLMVNKVCQRRQRGDESVFVRDVTFADGALVLPGQKFTKTWEIQNVGLVPWENRFLKCIDEQIIVHTLRGETLALAHNLTPSALRIPVPYTAPGALVQLSVEFTAPEPPGTVLSYWKTEFSEGGLCFPDSSGLWVKVRVNAAAASAFEER